MKKKIWKTLLLAVLAFGMALIPMTASAEMATSYTYAEDDNGYWVRTQDAYLPDRTITELGLKSPEDLYIDENNMLYIADTGNRRILKYDIVLGQVVGELTSPDFSSPRGVFVTENGDIYVADSGAKLVLAFDKDFRQILKLSKPETPIFADTNFEPKRIAVDGGGNIYLIGEGVYNGVIQLAQTGEFLGYFAVNEASLTFAQRVQRLLFTRAQLANLVDANPTVFTNVFVDRDGVVYTATSGLNRNGMKKHSTNGGNMFKTKVWSDTDLTDVYVDRRGMIYTCSADGFMTVYSKNGESIFDFGSEVTTVDIAGLFTSLPSIAVDQNGYIWAVDGIKGYLQSFKPTEYANMVYGAMNLYEEGHYEKALEQWNLVLQQNQMSVLAHNGVGKAYLHAMEYEAALEHFKVANNKELYSQAFWEVRNKWLQTYLPTILFALIGLLVLGKVIKALDRKYGKIKAFTDGIKGRLGRLPVLKDFAYAAKTPMHPMNNYYEIRKNRRGSVLGATIIYVVFFLLFMAYQTSKGFVYQTLKVEDMDIGSIVIGFLLMLGLSIICNYLVTSINDGDGTFRQIYMIPAYGMIPAMTSLFLVTVVSYGMTQTESFLLTIIMLIGVTWSAITIFVGLQTVHDYSFGETVKSIIITIVFMAIAAIVAIILSIMWDSLYSFIKSFGKELLQNVL